LNRFQSRRDQRLSGLEFLDPLIKEATMNNLTKTIVAGLTAMTLSTTLSAGVSYAGEMRGMDRGMRDEGHQGGYGRDIATGLAIGVGLALISKAIDDHPHTETRKQYVAGEHVIGDDPKGPPKTVEKPACKWVVVKVSVTNYGTAVTDKEKKEWRVKFEKAAVDYAKKFVKDNATKMGKTILKAIIEDTTITRTMDVLITYACVDDKGEVLETKVVGPIQDQYAMHWWTGSKLDEGNEAGKATAIVRNRPTTIVTAKK
jgi:hypothetical protein